MTFQEAELAGCWIIEPERRLDPRGYFARTFCAEEFARHGLPVSFPQCNTSFNARRGTLRGMHWQGEPSPEGKLIRCTRGAVFDVIVDIRAASPTRHRWFGIELSANNGLSLFVPPGLAHGYQTLADDTDVFYQMTERYQPELARGARFDDPALAIVWPIADPLVSDRDRAHPLLQERAGS